MNHERHGFLPSASGQPAASLSHRTFHSSGDNWPGGGGGLICDSGLDVRFKKHEALVLDPQGNELCRFERVGGVHVTTVMLGDPGHQCFPPQGP